MSSVNIDKNLHYKYVSTLQVNTQTSEEFYPIDINYSGTILKSNGSLSPKQGVIHLFFDKRKKFIYMILKLIKNYWKNNEVFYKQVASLPKKMRKQGNITI